uniref:Uncharacterized protein n=1 Tax=Rhizophora mucronata TaxID=61149 RepID=A0A2P2PRF6_RHIMU
MYCFNFSPLCGRRFLCCQLSPHYPSLPLFAPLAFSLAVIKSCRPYMNLSYATCTWPPLHDCPQSRQRSMAK